MSMLLKDQVKGIKEEKQKGTCIPPNSGKV